MITPVRDDMAPEAPVLGRCKDCGSKATQICERCEAILCDSCDRPTNTYRCCNACGWQMAADTQCIADEHVFSTRGSAQPAVLDALADVVKAGADSVAGQRAMYRLGLMLAGIDPDEYMADLTERVKHHARVIAREKGPAR